MKLYGKKAVCLAMACAVFLASLTGCCEGSNGLHGKQEGSGQETDTVQIPGTASGANGVPGANEPAISYSEQEIPLPDTANGSNVIITGFDRNEEGSLELFVYDRKGELFRKYLLSEDSRWIF